jgi:hypothetical protein
MAQKHSEGPRAPLFIDEERYILHPLWTAFFEQFLSHTVYLGNPKTNGTWRVARSGNDLHFDRLESGTWVNKGSFTA